jgi:uncharacterized membrane protein
MTMTNANAPAGPTSDDRLLGAAGYLTILVGFPVVAPVVIYAVTRQSRPFIAAHALQAAVLHVLLFPLLFVVWGGGFLVASTVGGGGAFLAVMLAALLGYALVHVVAIVRALRGQPYTVPLLGSWLVRQLNAPAPAP